MAYTIGKAFSFAAGHYIDGLPAGHKCRRVHGHTYTAEFEISAAELTGPGFVTDFGDLAPVGQMIRDRLDHRMLNDVLPAPATSENLARYLAEWFVRAVEPGIHGRLRAVVVRESPTTWARWEAER